jgi:trk system potassium uptake protein TrkH
MHPRNVANVVFAILLLTAAAMLIPLAVALWDGTNDALPLAVACGLTGLVGGLGFILTMQRRDGRFLSHRDGYLVGALGWLLACLAGALPFFLYAHLNLADPAWVPAAAHQDIPICDLPTAALHPGQEFCTVADSVFESISGFTTTGASVIRSGLWDDLSSRLSNGKPGLPRGFLLWRSLIQWLGGMGILVLAVTVLALVGVGGMQLMKAEVPGPTPGRLSPRIADTARLLWKLYVIISAAQVLALMAGGMDLYNAVNHTCTTMATGGFSTLAASVGGIDSPYIQWVFTFFMMVAGANFTLHFLLIFHRRVDYGKDYEFRLYLILFAASVVAIVVALAIAGLARGVEPTIRAAAFQVASILTTTGYATKDFTLWPASLQFLLLILMFVGGCAGSTGGGMKVARIAVIAKVAYRELLRIAHPRAVTPVRMGDEIVDERVVANILGVVILFMATFVASTLVMASMGLDLTTAISSVAACIGNVGPGLGDVGPAANYFFIPTPGKWLLSFNMLAGRLEIYTVLILFSPHFWNR